MRISLFIAALLFVGCASTQEPLPAPSGAPMGEGVHRFPVGPQARYESVDAPWEPNAFYPSLAVEVGDLEPTRDLRVKDAERARGARPLASRSSTAGAAWVLFQFYASTWSRADGATCRFAPTCSGFGRQAVSRHGVLGLVMTFGRLHRNHSDAEFYQADGPRLADPLALHDFWFNEPSDSDLEEHEVVELYWRLRRAARYTIPAPPTTNGQ